MTDVSAGNAPDRRVRPWLTTHAVRRGVTRLRLSLAAGLSVTEPVVVAFVATLALSAYFVALPGVDLAVSALFHSDAGFALAQDPALKVLRKSSSWVMGVMLLGLIVTSISSAPSTTWLLVRM